MSRRRKGPLRNLTDPERAELVRLSRSSAAPAAQVAHAVALLAVAAGSDYQSAARAAGRRSGDAVPHHFARFDREGLPTVVPRRGEAAGTARLDGVLERQGRGRSRPGPVAPPANRVQVP